MAGSLLDTFLILFESDASEVKKGAEDAEKAVDDLEDSIEGADDTATELGASFGEMAKQAGIALLALVSISAARQGLINTAESVDALGKFSNRLGVSVEDVDAWGGAVESAGGTAEGFRASIDSLNEKLVETAIKGQGELIPFFAQMGIAITDANGRARSTLDILPQLSDAFQNLNRQESAAIGKKLGLDNATILLLQEGRVKLDALIERQRDLGVVTKEQAILAAEFNDQLGYMGRAFDTVGRLIAVELLPFITKFMGMITDAVIFLKNNKAFAVSFFGAIAAVITALLIPALAKALLLIAPFLGIAAAVAAVAAAFALVADDIYNFIQGNDSAIGEIIKKWDTFSEKIKAIFGDLKKVFDDFVDSLPDISVEGAIEAISESIPDIDIDSALKAAKEFIGISSDSSINTQTPNTISNSVTRGGDKTYNMGGVNVDARGGGSEGAGRAAGNAVGSQMKKAVNSFDDGVLA